MRDWEALGVPADVGEELERVAANINAAHGGPVISAARLASIMLTPVHVPAGENWTYAITQRIVDAIATSQQTEEISHVDLHRADLQS